MAYVSTKTYGHDIGLSSAFRQWRADSHCRFIHGYALAIRLEFEADMLDARNWVIDFGALKGIKEILCDTFDHKLLVAEDDPKLSKLLDLQEEGLASVKIIPATGCERFAEHVFDIAQQWLYRAGHHPRVKMRSVEVREHGANSAIYTGR